VINLEYGWLMQTTEKTCQAVSCDSPSFKSCLAGLSTRGGLIRGRTVAPAPPCLCGDGERLDRP